MSEGLVDAREKLLEYERRLDVLAACLNEQVVENTKLQGVVKELQDRKEKKVPSKQSSGFGSLRSAFSRSSSKRPTHDLSTVVAIEKDTFRELQAVESVKRERDKFKIAAERTEEECSILQSQLKEMEEQLKEIQDQQRREREHSTPRLSRLEVFSSSSSEFTDDSDEERDPAAVAMELKEKYMREKRARYRMEALVFEREEKIEDLKHGIRLRERRAKTLASITEKEKERRQSLQEDITKYEERLASLESDLLDALQKEGERRMDAEYYAEKLSRKVDRWKDALERVGVVLESNSSSSSTSEGSQDTDESSSSSDEDDEEDEDTHSRG